MGKDFVTSGVTKKEGAVTYIKPDPKQLLKDEQGRIIDNPDNITGRKIVVNQCACAKQGKKKYQHQHTFSPTVMKVLESKFLGGLQGKTKALFKSPIQYSPPGVDFLKFCNLAAGECQTGTLSKVTRAPAKLRGT